MKKIIAYALVTKRGNMGVIDGRLPIFWNKKLAKKEAELYKLEVKKITLTPHTYE